MQGRGLKSRFLVGTALALAAMAPGFAQNSRSFIATTGSDSNSCIQTAPCYTFTRALSNTKPGGEIVILNTGAYGLLNITQPVIVTATGVTGLMGTFSSSANGVIINTTGNVTLSGLTIHAFGVGTDGVLVNQVGFLRLYNVMIEGFSNNGLEFDSGGGLAIYNSQFNDNQNAGILISNSSASAYVQDTGFDHNATGVQVTAGSVTVANSFAHFNTTGFDVSGGTLVLTGDDSVLNGTGITVSASGTAQFTRCLISQNTTAYNLSGGTVSGSTPGTTVITGPTSGTLGTATPLQ